MRIVDRIAKKVLVYVTDLCYAICSKVDNREGGKMRRKLERLAQEILVDNDMLSQLPVNLLEIAHSNNIEVYYTELPDDVSGAIKYDKEQNKFKIIIKASLPRVRQRFTLAHELAHYFLEKELLQNSELHIDTLYRKDSESETNIDYLAGALLMDKDLLQDLYEINPSIYELAKVFVVSESALRVRLSVLGII